MFIFFLDWFSRAPTKHILGRSARRWEAWLIRVVLVLLASYLLFQPEANSELKQVRRVVVFYELGISSPAVALIDREMRATLDDSRLPNRVISRVPGDDPFRTIQRISRSFVSRTFVNIKTVDQT